MEISKKESGTTEKIEEHLRKISETKRKWTKSTEEFNSQPKELPMLKGGGGQNGGVEGKVFVRADLNHPTPGSKR